MRRFEGARCEGSRVRGCGAKVLRCENWRVQRVSILKHCEQCIRSGTAGQPTILDAVVDDAVLVCGPRQHNHSGGTHVAPPWRETLGVEPGSVTPFGLLNDSQVRLNVVLDEAMMAHDLLNYHPLVNTMTTAIARGDLLRFLDATGHKPRILAVSAPA